MVVEASIRSGVLNPAHWSDALDRPVMAVPGPVSSINSAGAHSLVRAGQATIVTRAQDVLEDLGMPSAVAGEAGADMDRHTIGRTRPPEQLRPPGVRPDHTPSAR